MAASPSITMEQRPKAGMKLRASCDACNQAKVKCSKSKPVCRRCEVQKAQCVYGLSLRAGKRMASIGDNRAVAPPQPRASEDNANENALTRELSNDAFNNIMSKSTSQSSTPQEDSIGDFLQSLVYNEDSNDTSNHRVSNPFQHTNKSHSHIGLSDMNFNGQPPFQLPPTSQFDQPDFMASSTTNAFDWQHDHHNSTMPSTPMSLDLAYSPTDVCSTTSMRNEANAATAADWYQTIPSLCQQFYLPPPTPPASSGSYLPNLNRSKCQCETSLLSAQEILLRISDAERISFDVALAANREVLKRCSAMIECNCYSYEDTNAITLSSVIAKMVSIYWARAVGLGTSAQPDGPLGLGDMANAGFEGGGKRRGMLTMGAYRLDQADEERLKTEIVLIELSKLDKLVAEFQKGFIEAGLAWSRSDSGSHCGSMEDEKRPVQDTKHAFWLSLVEFLTRNLRAVTLDLRSKVRKDEDTR